MPAPRRPQGGSLFYALITFVVLFIIATVFAVVYYIKAESYRTDSVNMEKDMSRFATRKELAELSETVGERIIGKSRLRTMLDYLEEETELILGDKFADLSAEGKREAVVNAYNDLITQLSDDPVPPTGDVGLIRLAQVLSENLRNARQTVLSLQQQLDDFSGEYSRLMQASKQKDDEFLNQIETLAAQARDIEQSFNRLRDQMEQDRDEQVHALQAQLDQARQNVEKQHAQLLQERARYIAIKESRDRYQDQIKAIKGAPDSSASARKADGKIISVDNKEGIVFLNIGTDDRVYPGLTFSVYDKNIPIPKDGQSKAEIEVVDIQKNFSIGRIIRSQPKNPIITDDIIANLIWDSRAANVFVVAGDFDLDNDGKIDRNGQSRILELIKQWGGTVAQAVSIETDFVVLGLPPTIPLTPTHEQLEIDPLAMEKYQASLDRLNNYKKIQQQAETLSIPIFNADRFLYFVGYHSLAGNSTTS